MRSNPSLDTPGNNRQRAPRSTCDQPSKSSRKSRKDRDRLRWDLRDRLAETLREAAAFCSGEAGSLLQAWKHDQGEALGLDLRDWTIDELAGGGALEWLPFELAEEVRQTTRLQKLAGKVALCERKARSRVCGRCGTEDGSEAQVYRCGARGCVLCEKARTEKMQRFLPIARAAAPGSLRFLTLTVPNVFSLRGEWGQDRNGNWKKGVARTSVLSECFVTMRRLLEKTAVCFACKGWVFKRRPQLKWKRRLTRCCCSTPEPRSHAITAGIRVIECTYCEDAGWHPHLHVLVSMPWTPQATLAEAWTEITRALWPAGPSNGMGVDVRNVRDKAGRDGRDEAFDVEDALRELLKYPTKVADLVGRPVQLADWVNASRGCRFVQAFGEWAKWQELLEEPEDEEDDLDQLQGPCPSCGEVFWLPVWIDLERGPRDVHARGSPLPESTTRASVR